MVAKVIIELQSCTLGLTPFMMSVLVLVVALDAAIACLLFVSTFLAPPPPLRLLVIDERASAAAA